MTTANNELMPVYELVGQTMSDLGAHYEILILRFGEYEIHVSCFARILHSRKILLTTQDYQSWDKKRPQAQRHVPQHCKTWGNTDRTNCSFC